MKITQKDLVKMNKIYKANDELVSLLENFGFVEVTAGGNEMKSKRKFKFPPRLKKHIRFNHNNIVIFDGSSNSRDLLELNQQQLRAVLFFFSITPKDFREVSGDGKFSIEKIESGLKWIKRCLSVTNLRNSKKEKFERIMETYTSIKID